MAAFLGASAAYEQGNALKDEWDAELVKRGVCEDTGICVGDTEEMDDCSEPPLLPPGSPEYCVSYAHREALDWYYTCIGRGGADCVGFYEKMFARHYAKCRAQSPAN